MPQGMLLYDMSMHGILVIRYSTWVSYIIGHGGSKHIDVRSYKFIITLMDWCKKNLT